MKLKLLFIGIIVSISSTHLFSQQDSTKNYRGAEIDVRLDKGDIMLGGTLGLDLKAAREVLGRDLAVAVHEDQEGLPRIVLHHEGLDHRVLVDAEFARADRGASVLLVAIDVLAELDPFGAELTDRRGHGHLGFRHGHLQVRL